MPRFHTEETGASAIIVVIAIVALFGFTALAVDAARMYEERRQLQRTADVSALSGAQRLQVGEAAAEATGRNYVDVNPSVHHPGPYNPATGDLVDAYTRGSAAVPPESCAIDGVVYDCVESTVMAPTFDFLFATVLGFRQRSFAGGNPIWARATAVLGSGAPGGEKLVPWMVLDCPNGARYPDEQGPEVLNAVLKINPSCPYVFSDDYASGPRVNLFLSTGGSKQGNFQGADLNTEPGCPGSVDGLFKKGGGGDEYRDILSGEADPRVPCRIGKGARVAPQTGELVGPTKQGLIARGVTDACMNETRFHETVEVDEVGDGVVRILDHHNPCLVVLLLIVNADPENADAATDTPGSARIPEFQHPQALDEDLDGKWRFAAPSNGSSKLYVARRFAFYYITSKPENPTKEPYKGLFMKALDSANADLDGVFDPTSGIGVVKLVR